MMPNVQAVRYKAPLRMSFMEGLPMEIESETVSAQAIWLSRGFHESPEDGMNIMECVAYVCGQEHSSYPSAACPVIAEVVRNIADTASEVHRQTLVQFIFPIACSASSEAVMTKRLYYCVEFLLRQLAPVALSQLGMHPEAVMLKTLPTIQDAGAAEYAQKTLRRLFMGAYLNPVTSKLSHTLSTMEGMASTAARMMTNDVEPITLLRQLRATMDRFEAVADAHLANTLFGQKRVLLENLLCIGPNKPVPEDLKTLRRQRLTRLEAKMANGTFGRQAGSDTEL
jgi:hypothetical protein